MDLQPGRTRAVNYFLVNRRFYFVDLPGYGYSKISRSVSESWQALLEPYFINNPYLRLVLLLIDARHGMTALDEQMVSWLAHHRLHFLVILTKRDKLSNNQFTRIRNKFRSRWPDIDAVPFSARNRTGVTEVQDLMEQVITDDQMYGNG